MTVSTTTSKISYTGNAVTTSFSFPYPFIASSDINVYVAGVLKTLTTDYTISGTAPYPAGANVVFNSAPANGAAIILQRIRPYTQTLDLVTNDPLPADPLELELDSLTMICQQLLEQLTRAITIPTTDITGTTTTLPAAATRANQALVFDASGNVAVGALTTTAISAAMIAVVQATTLALARTALGIGSNFTTEGTIASAATTDLGALSSQEIVVSGSVGITSFGNTASLAAPLYMLRFSGAPLLTNSATLILPGGVNFQAAAGDTAIAKFEGTSTWRVFPMKANGQAVVPTVVGPALTGITSINSGQIGGIRNYLRNGAFNVWQRNTSSALASAAAYSAADRWAAQGPNAAGIFSRDTSITPGLGFQFNAKVGRNNGSAVTTTAIIVQALETADSIPLAGQQVTISYYAKAGANYSSAASALNLILGTGTGTDQSAQNFINGAWTGQANAISVADTLTTSWQRFQHTVTLGSTVNQLGVEFNYVPVGTAGADDNFYITGVQLEVGNVATVFENRLFEVELALCQRYYCKSFPYATVPAQAAGNGGAITVKNPIAAGAPSAYALFKTTMRTAPSVTTYNPATATANWRDNNTAADITVSLDPQGNVGSDGVLIATSGTVAAIGDILTIHYTASAEL